MGDAAPPQPSAGGFVPLLGAGMGGPLPGAVSGPVSGTRGSAVPQLHSAIVERLRARIELCRRHHSSCENRYQRGQAENTDRERENTLQLLNIVHQGPGNRKTKHNKTAPQQPPEYNRVNGEQKSQNSAGGEPKNPARIALEGSLRRKLERNPTPGYNPKTNGISSAAFGTDFKRVRLDGNDGMGHSGCTFTNGQSQPIQGAASMGHSLHRKDNNMSSHPIGSDLFSLTLKEMKKEPGEVNSCGQASTDNSMMVFDFKDEPGSQIDPDLQDLLDELSKSVPLCDLEFEKMLNCTIKQDDPFNLDLGRPSQSCMAKPSSQLEKMVIKTEYSPGYSQGTGGSPQLQPASAGPAFSISTSTLSSSPVTSAPQNQSQGSQGASIAGRSIANWPEVSHAEQLKQMAANQQPTAMLHHHHHQQQQHQQNQAAAAAAKWSSTLPAHSGAFGQEKNTGPASHCPQRISPQNAILTPMSSSQAKGMNDCLFKPGTNSNSNHIDIKVLNTKPLSHFSHKPSSQQMPPMLGSQNKSTVLHYTQQQQQQQTPIQAQPHHPPHFQNQTLPRLPSVTMALQTKGLQQKMQLNQQMSGQHYKMVQPRQNQPPMVPGPRPPAGNNFLSNSAQTQQKLMGKTQALQRQLALQQQIMADPDKMSAQDQLNRHLTRPPPDYKQPQRNMVGAQQPNQYAGAGLAMGMNSTQPLPNTVLNQGGLQTNPCHLPPGQGTKMPPVPNDRMYGSVPDPQQGDYTVPATVTQLQQHGNQNQIGMDQNNSRFPGPTNLGNSMTSFRSGPVSNTQHMRPTLKQEAPGMTGQRLPNMMTNSSMVGSNWPPQGSKQTAAPPMGGRRFPNTLQPHKPVQPDMTNHHFPQRAMAPPNQIASDISMHPLNSMDQTISGQAVAAARGLAPRPSQPRMPALPTMASMNQLTPIAPVNSGTFTAASQNSRGYQGNSHSSDLTFDFLQQGDNTVPGINSDSDFIDSLLKSGSGNDDWMKDINLDEILGSHS